MEQGMFSHLWQQPTAHVPALKFHWSLPIRKFLTISLGLMLSLTFYFNASLQPPPPQWWLVISYGKYHLPLSLASMAFYSLQLFWHSKVVQRNKDLFTIKYLGTLSFPTSRCESNGLWNIISLTDIFFKYIFFLLERQSYIEQEGETEIFHL